MYNLAWGGLKNCKNGGDSYEYFYVFACRILFFGKLFEFCLDWSFKCTFKLGFLVREIFLIFRLSLFTVHVRLVLSPCQAGGYNISHNEYSHAYFVLAPLYMESQALALIDIFIILTLHSIKYCYIINVYINVLYIDLQILNSVLCYISLILHFLLCLNCFQFCLFACAHQAWRRTLYICLNLVVGQSTFLVLTKLYARAYSL